MRDDVVSFVSLGCDLKGGLIVLQSLFLVVYGLKRSFMFQEG